MAFEAEARTERCRLSGRCQCQDTHELFNNAFALVVYRPVSSELSDMQPRVFMTTKEVARYLRVNQYTIYRLVSQRKLPAFKVGAQWRFKRSILEEWLKKQLNFPTAH